MEVKYIELDLGATLEFPLTCVANRIMLAFFSARGFFYIEYE